MRAVELLHDLRGGLGLLDRERLALPRRGHEGEHHEVGVRVHEDVLHELVGPDAAQVVEAPRPLVRLAARGWSRSVSGLAPAGRRLQPRARRVHEVPLHVEDELVAVHGRARGVQVERGFLRQVVEAAAAALGGVGRVEAEERGGHPAGRNPGTSAAASRAASRSRSQPPFAIRLARRGCRRAGSGELAVAGRRRASRAGACPRVVASRHGVLLGLRTAPLYLRRRHRASVTFGIIAANQRGRSHGWRRDSTKAVLYALGANGAIASPSTWRAFITGSGSMLARRCTPPPTAATRRCCSSA
jgi:hypothetical protein